MAKQKYKNRYWWFAAALLAALLAAPNATIIRVAVNEADPFYWAFSRFLICAVVLLPFMLLRVKSRHIRRGGKDALLAGLFLSIALLSYTLAIYHSQASYVSILTMLTPITLIFISARFFREKINRRKVAGIALAMIGALVVVSLPLMATGNVTTAAYPLATALTLLNCVTFALTYIYMRKANEAGMPMMGVLGIISFIGAAVTAPLFLLFGDTARMPNDPSFFMAVFYSAIGVSVVFRAISVSAYERIGAVSTAAVQYIETLASVVIPVLIISEKLSLEMIAGGLMILAGVYVIESKEAKVGKR